MKKIIIVLVIVAAIGAMGFGLMKNKEKIDAQNKMAPAVAVSVSVTEVKEKAFSENLSVLGTIMANSEVNVVSETQGRVKSVMFEAGEVKSAGSALVKVDSELKEANLASVKANYEKAKTDLDRYEELYKEKAVTDVQVETARYAFKVAEAQYITARRQLSDTQITTPVSGTINTRMVEVGSMVQPGTPIANVVDISRLKVKIFLAEKEVFKIKEGEVVDIATDVYPGVKFQGKVNIIGVKGDEAHNYPVEIVLANNSKNPLKAGMFCRVQFSSIEGRNMLSIPREALVGSAKKPQVYVVQDNRAVLRDITLGAESGTSLEVLSGLQAGEQVVVNGQINLKNNTEIRVK